MNTCTLLGRYVLTLILATPLLYKQVHVRQFLFDLVRVRTGFVALVDGKHHRYACRLCVADSLAGLRHYAIVGCNNDDSYIRHLCTTCTHGGECLMTWGIQEGDVLA